MKNLPERIYLNINMTPQEIVETKDKDFHEATKTWEITWSEESLSEHDPEYIHKDAFIEKACEWLRTHSEVDYFELIPEANYCGAGNLNKKKMIEDFEEYLKK